MRRPSATTRTWEEALAFASALNGANLCGFSSGWRLPNVLELESLISLGVPISANWLTGNENGFLGIGPNRYWSSTTYSPGLDRAWAMDFGINGRVTASKTASYFVLPVRGETIGHPAELWQTGQIDSYEPGDDGDRRDGKAWPSPRFVHVGDDTVRDDLTGLIWPVRADTPGPSACAPGIGKILSDAYAYIQCLNASNYLGYNDWRLPNRDELKSLIDHGRHNPALPEGHPFSGLKTGYRWTSDTDIQTYSMGWAVDMGSGATGSFYKNVETNTLWVWPVRGPLTLKVLLRGDGAGTVKGHQVSCSGKRCLGIYSTGEVITLTAESAVDSIFGGWVDCPSLSGRECSVVMDRDVTVTATFLRAYSIWGRPSRISFGKVGRHGTSPPKYVAVKNVRDAGLTVRALDVGGENPSDFLIGGDCAVGTVLAPGQECAIEVRVSAQDYGARKGELVVLFGDTGISPRRVRLAAKAVPAKMVVQPKNLFFGRVSAGDSSEQQVAVENRGLTDLTIMSVAATGDQSGDFIPDSSDCTVLKKDETCAIRVTFRPGGSGKRTAVLEIVTDAPKKGTARIRLKGEGV